MEVKTLAIVDIELLEALKENTETLIGEYAWMQGTPRGDCLLNQLRRDAEKVNAILECIHDHLLCP